MGGAAGSLLTSVGSSALGSSQSGTQSRQGAMQGKVNELNQPITLGDSPLLGMVSPYQTGNVQGMVGSSQNNAYNTAMSDKPMGLQDFMQMGASAAGGGGGSGK